MTLKCDLYLLTARLGAQLATAAPLCSELQSLCFAPKIHGSQTNYLDRYLDSEKQLFWVKYEMKN